MVLFLIFRFLYFRHSLATLTLHLLKGIKVILLAINLTSTIYVCAYSFQICWIAKHNPVAIKYTNLWNFLIDLPICLQKISLSWQSQFPLVYFAGGSCASPRFLFGHGQSRDSPRLRSVQHLDQLRWEQRPFPSMQADADCFILVEKSSAPIDSNNFFVILKG